MCFSETNVIAHIFSALPKILTCLKALSIYIFFHQGKKMVADMWNSLPKYHHEEPEQIQDIWAKVWGFVQFFLSYFTT